MKKALNFKVSALCGKLLRKAAGSIVFAVTALLLSGCGGIMGVYNSSITSPTKTGFFLAYDSETVLEQSQVATITSANGLEIDGIDCEADNFKSANADKFWGTGLVADVMPGVHKVRLTRASGGATIIMNPVEYNFEAGKIYNFHANAALRPTIYENKDAEIAAKIAANRKNLVFKPKKAN